MTNTIQETGLFVYPAQGWRKAMFKWPVQLWRLGLGPIMGQVMMVITQTGRKSGLPRRTMVEHYWLFGHPYVFAAWGDRSQWVQNLLADPRCTIQTARGTMSARAVRVADDQELKQVYRLFMRKDPILTQQFLQMYGIEADPDDFAANKDRLFCFRFDPTAEPTPPPLEADLVWVWPILAAVAALFWLVRGKKG